VCVLKGPEHVSSLFEGPFPEPSTPYMYLCVSKVRSNIASRAHCIGRGDFPSHLISLILLIVPQLLYLIYWTHQVLSNTVSVKAYCRSRPEASAPSQERYLTYGNTHHPPPLCLLSLKDHTDIQSNHALLDPVYILRCQLLHPYHLLFLRNPLLYGLFDLRIHTLLIQIIIPRLPIIRLPLLALLNSTELNKGSGLLLHLSIFRLMV
jgi:hypothetical protein